MADETIPERAALLAVLGLPPDAVEPQISRSYRRLARQSHPDVSGAARGEAEAARRFREISDAYHRLLTLPVRPPALPPPPAPVPTARPSRRPPIVAGPVIVTPSPGANRRKSHGS